MHSKIGQSSETRSSNEIAEWQCDIFSKKTSLGVLEDVPTWDEVLYANGNFRRVF
jgi:hypothetical protein